MNGAAGEDEFASILRRHGLWLAHREGGVPADLRSRDLNGADLAGVDLSGARLCGTTLRGANLTGASFRGCWMRSCNLDDSCLRDADVSGAILRNGSLRRAVLTAATFEKSDLRGVDFEGCLMSWNDSVLVGERLWQAAGDDLERQKLAAFVIRNDDWCWAHFRVLQPDDRMWILRHARTWISPEEELPPFLQIVASSSRYDATVQQGAET